MEDRRTPGLYLELADWSADRYRKERVPALADLPGAARCTWWENAFPGRADLPRRLPEFPLLGVTEAAASFLPPASAPPGIAGLHFVATPRPGQGRLTGRPTIGLSLVLISPKHADGARALRDWGDFVHLRHIAEAAVPGYTMITPYESAAGGEPRYLHLYEMDTDDPEASFQAMTPLVAARLGGTESDAYREWAWHPELRIEYVNTFRRLGEQGG